MDNLDLSIQLSKTRGELAAAQEAEIALIEGLGNNIFKHLGTVELGIPIKIFMRNQANQVRRYQLLAIRLQFFYLPGFLFSWFSAFFYRLFSGFIIHEFIIIPAHQ